MNISIDNIKCFGKLKVHCNDSVGVGPVSSLVSAGDQLFLRLRKLKGTFWLFWLPLFLLGPAPPPYTSLIVVIMYVLLLKVEELTISLGASSKIDNI